MEKVECTLSLSSSSIPSDNDSTSSSSKTSMKGYKPTTTNSLSDDEQYEFNHHDRSPNLIVPPQHSSKCLKFYSPLIGQDIEDLTLHIQHLNQMFKSGCTGFDMEFNFIEKLCSQSNKRDFSAAFCTENQSKNRYLNVLPPEDTRVKLQQRDGIKGSDYINANHIVLKSRGYQKQHYISTQGPVPSTVTDFWRMIWERDCNLIVMLTKEIEFDRVKCTRYWPEDGTKIYGTILVRHLHTEESNPDILIRTLQIQNLNTSNGPCHPRTITHFQYTEWPDHGLPSSTNIFLNLVGQVRFMALPNSPMLIHCSAGIGRSGTFCTVHAIISMMHECFENYNKLPKINIVDMILNIRSQRPGMVQNKEQYMFCYLSIEEEYIRLKSCLLTSLNHTQWPSIGSMEAQGVTTNKHPDPLILTTPVPPH